jgi:hypothetical protein
MEGLGIPMTATVLTGKYKSTVLHSLIVVPSRYCSECVAGSRWQACGSHSTWFPPLFHPVVSEAWEPCPAVQARQMLVNPEP